MLMNCGVGEDSWESLVQQGDQTSQSWRKSTLNIHRKDWCWSSNTLDTWCEEPAPWKDPDAGKDWGQEEKEMTEDEMVGWHHRLNELEFEQALWDGEGQWSLGSYSPWGCKADMIDQLNNNNLNWWVQNFTLQEEKPDVLSTEELSIGMINLGKLRNLYICMHVCICDAGKDWKRGEWVGRRWDGWITSLTQWTSVWANSGR